MRPPEQTPLWPSTKSLTEPRLGVLVTPADSAIGASLQTGFSTGSNKQSELYGKKRTAKNCIMF